MTSKVVRINEHEQALFEMLLTGLGNREPDTVRLFNKIKQPDTQPWVANERETTS